MKNDASDAELGAVPNCQLSDVEICYKNIQEIYTVDEDGTWGEHIETYTMEATPAYYYCDSCGDDWVINSVQTREQAFKLVKEHLNA